MMERLRAAGIVGQTLLVAFAGGALANWAGMPVAWLAGSMVAVACMAMLGRSVYMPLPLRDFGLITAGMALGSTVTAEALSTVQRYPLSLMGLMLSIGATIILSKTILEKGFGWDRPTAILASAPGALSMVMALAADSSADVRRVAIVQAVRLFLLVTVMPLAVSAAGPLQPPAAHDELTALSLAILYAATGLVAWAMMHLRFANPLFLGGMLTATVLNISGLLHGQTPQPASVIGMLAVGTYSGMRFSGTNPRYLLGMLPPAVAVLMSALVVTLCFGFAVHKITGLSLGNVLTAFAPGGVEAMIIMGAAMGLDTLYITTHHVIRSIGLNLLLPLFISMDRSNDD